MISTQQPNKSPASGITASEQMDELIRNHAMRLQNLPGWEEWQHQKFHRTLFFDDPIASAQAQDMPKEFQFPSHVDSQHEILFLYLVLKDSVQALKDCEYYFRRYPFRELPIPRHTHLRYICEMYFSRIYEIYQRIQNVLNAANQLATPGKLDVGDYSKRFKKFFDQEIRARNRSHHHERFSSAEINRIELREMYLPSIGATSFDPGEYRRLVNDWVKRVRRDGALMDEILEDVAKAITENCEFGPFEDL